MWIKIIQAEPQPNLLTVVDVATGEVVYATTDIEAYNAFCDQNHDMFA